VTVDAGGVNVLSRVTREAIEALGLRTVMSVVGCWLRLCPRGDMRFRLAGP